MGHRTATLLWRVLAAELSLAACAGEIDGESPQEIGAAEEALTDPAANDGSTAADNAVVALGVAGWARVVQGLSFHRR
jgi:hypothetical protein